MNGDLEDDSDDETIAIHGDLKRSPSDEKLPPPPPFDSRMHNNNTGTSPLTIAAPRPGYAAPVSALTMPEPAATPVGQPRVQTQMQQRGPAPFSPSVHSMPNSPHPLQPPSTPITPAFARPPKPAEVKFESDSIIRGQGEDVPLGRRGNKRDDFWRRFSMVIHEEGGRKNTSSWLEKTQSSSASMSRLVWIIGILLLIIIGGAIGFGVYVSHNATTNSTPKALGGSENQGASFHPTATSAGAVAASTTQGVSPTNTVAKRWAEPWPAPSPEPMVIHAVHKNTSAVKRHLRNKRRLIDLD